jgi:hypothetical protein
MTRLETVRVSQASADQRRGRAGRLEPGVCYRLWPEESQRGLLPFTPPEILDADLAPLALELRPGGGDATTLPWLTPPPAAALAHGARICSISAQSIRRAHHAARPGAWRGWASILGSPIWCSRAASWTRPRGRPARRHPERARFPAPAAGPA